MSPRSAVRKADVTRAIRAVRKAGLTVFEVRLKKDEIVLILHGGAPTGKSPADDAYDKWRAEKAKRGIGD